MSQIQYIAVDKLDPHPDNPRKENFGDLTELAESVKVNGILQNLTVVPKSYILPRTSAVGKTEMMSEPSDTIYTVVIGHRRLAAAKLAGLETVPCIIAEMSQAEQVRAMLMENIQRKDLNPYEQAQGFQMMLDLGETASDISKQTGFSNSYVRKRVKYLELDKDKFAQSIERGGTFSDYDALLKINDSKVRDKVLDKVGTENFAWELKSALQSEARAENKRVLIAELKKFASKIKDSEASKYQYVKYISLDNTTLDVPKDAGSAKYFYTESSHSLTLYRERQQQEKPKKTPEEIEREGRVKRIKDLFKQAYELRLAFAKGFRAKGKDANTIDEKTIELLFASSRRPDMDVFRALFGIKGKFRMSWEKKEKGETYDEALSRIMADNANAQNTTLLFWGAYCNLESPDATCLSCWGPAYSASEKLKVLYDYLSSLGYDMSDEEKALMDGSHELYDEADPDDDDEHDECDDDMPSE